MVLQVAQRREHADCVLLLRQKQTACQLAINTPTRLESNSCTVSDPAPTDARRSHQHRQSIQQDTPVAYPSRHPTACELGSTAAGLESFKGEASAKVPEVSSSSRTQTSDATALGGSNCNWGKGSCDAAESASQVLRDANWGQAVSKEQGKAWMQAAKAGDIPVLEKLLKSNVALLAYRGQGTSFGFGGAPSCISCVKLTVPHGIAVSYVLIHSRHIK